MKKRMNGSRKHLSKLAKAGDKLFSDQWLIQFGAICHRADPERGHLTLLLITTRGSRRWVLPKGNPIKGLKPSEVAASEAEQEAGVKGKVKKRPYGRYTYLKPMEDGSSRPCIVEVFTLQAANLMTDFKEKDQREADWVAPAVASTMVEEPELRLLLQNFGSTTNPKTSRAQSNNDPTLSQPGQRRA